MKSVYEYSNYKKYLNEYIRSQPKNGRGIKRKWAEIAGCQVAYVSHVLVGEYNFSSEQAEAISKSLGLSLDEQEFVILLLQLERAGTQSLKDFYSKIIIEKREKHSTLRARMSIKENLTLEDQAIYYSKWYYSAIHMILTIAEYRTPESISEYFDLPLSLVRDVLRFLLEKNFVGFQKKNYNVTGPFLHIGKDSPLINQHHYNWRTQALKSLAVEKESDLHFASCFSISKEDMAKLKSMITRHIQESAEMIKPSKEEKLMALCIDLFEV
jgi:uncharacterized protein (TIGR02147 family)